MNSTNTLLEIWGYRIEGWKAMALLYLIWLAPALLVGLMILRLKMTCG